MLFRTKFTVLLILTAVSAQAETHTGEDLVPEGEGSTIIDPKVRSRSLTIDFVNPTVIRGEPFDGKEFNGRLDFFVKDGIATRSDQVPHIPILEKEGLRRKKLSATGNYCWVMVMNIDSAKKDADKTIRIPKGSQNKQLLSWGFGRDSVRYNQASYAWGIFGQSAELNLKPGELAGVECYGENVKAEQIENALSLVYGKDTIKVQFNGDR